MEIGSQSKPSSISLRPSAALHSGDSTSSLLHRDHRSRHPPTYFAGIYPMKKNGGMRRTKATMKGTNVQDKENRINELPDDILISIISRLPLREATATCLLSSRWRHLYNYTTHLDLPPFEGGLVSNYVGMINRILDSYKACEVVKEFYVDMPCFAGADIGRWLEFAFARKVEALDIGLYGLCSSGDYTLGLNGGQLLPALKSLKKISLAYIQVDDEEVKFLLSNSPLLESLSISHSKRLRNALIVGCKLKHLDISHSVNVELIEVRDMINLVSLRCYYLPSTYVLKLSNVPKLSDFSTKDNYHNTLAEILFGIPFCIHDQLQQLKLETSTGLIRANLPTYILPNLVDLKHLKLKVYINPHDTSALFPLIEACPSLETVDIKFLWVKNWTKFEGGEISVRPPKKKLSANLKKLKLSGYRGSNEDLEFAAFIMKNTVTLQELIVEPCDKPRHIRRAATARAYQQLLPLKPDSAKLLII